MLLVNHAEPADGYVRTDAWLAGIPDEWSSFSMAYQYGESHYQISVSRGDAEYCVTLDGVLLPDDRIPLKDDGQNHTVEIIQN